MILKYDVYFQQNKNDIIITQLIPQKIQWKLRIDNMDVESIKEYITSIQEGLPDEEYHFMISNKGSSVKFIDSFLNEKKLISVYDSDKYANSYAKRQLEVFDSWSRTESDPYVFQQKLEKSKVLVVGAGGVGSSIINILIRCGIGEIVVADFDIIEESNLARQCFYGVNDIGKRKVEVLADRINNMGLGRVIPVFSQIDEHNIIEIISAYKVNMVTGLTIPTSSFSKKLYSTILKHNIPVASVGEHDAGPLFTEEAQILIFLEHLYSHFQLQKSHEEKRDFQYTIDRHPSYLPEIEIATAICADEIIRYLSGYSDSNLVGGYYGLEPINHMLRYHRFA